MGVVAVVSCFDRVGFSFVHVALRHAVSGSRGSRLMFAASGVYVVPLAGIAAFGRFVSTDHRNSLRRS